jgi:hypothetical protein
MGCLTDERYLSKIEIPQPCREKRKEEGIDGLSPFSAVMKKKLCNISQAE